MKRLLSLSLAWALFGVGALGAAPAAEVGDGALQPALRTAWDAFVGDASEARALENADPLLRSVMTRVSPEEFARFQSGVDPTEVVLLDGRVLADFLSRILGDPFAIPFFTIDSGGAVSTGGDFRLEGSIGQLDTGLAIGPGKVLLSFGGFREPIDYTTSPIFSDGFESGDTSGWSAP